MSEKIGRKIFQLNVREDMIIEIFCLVEILPDSRFKKVNVVYKYVVKNVKKLFRILTDFISRQQPHIFHQKQDVKLMPMISLLNVCFYFLYHAVLRYNWRGLNKVFTQKYLSFSKQKLDILFDIANSVVYDAKTIDVLHHKQISNNK